MKITIPFVILFLLGCSNISKKNSIKRSISSTTFERKDPLSGYKTVAKRLTYLNLIIHKINEALPQKGSPRFYLFDFFSSKALPIISETNELQHLLNKNSFIPETPSALNNLFKLVYYYKIMNEAGIYLNSSQIIDQDSKEITILLRKLNFTISRYEDEVNTKLNLYLYPQKSFNMRSKFRLELIKNLLSRVEENIYLFKVNKSANQEEIENEKSLMIQNTFSAIYNISYSSKQQLDDTYQELIKSNNYKFIYKRAQNLMLPDSSSINGSEDSFEKVMSVQLSFELIHFIIKRQLRDRV